MASKNQIQIRIGIEGDEDVKRKLDGVRDSGKKAGDDISKALNQPGSGQGFGGKTEESRAAAERLREVLHTLRPVLDTAGLGIGNLGAFARVAGTGFAAFGAAVVGSVIVGLAKLADQSDVAKKKLADLGASKGTFNGLDEDAKKLGTSPEKLTGGIQELLRLRKELNNNGAVIRPTKFEGPDGTLTGVAPDGTPEPALGQLSDEKLRAANRSLIQLLEAGKAEDPAKAAQDLFRSLRTNKGVLTPDALKNLSDQSYGGAEKFAQSLPQNFSNLQAAQRFLDKGGKVTGEDSLRALERVEPEAAKAAKAVRGLGQAFDGLGASFNNLTKSVAGEDLGKLLTGEIDKVSHTLEETGKEIDAIKKLASDLNKSIDLKKGFSEGLKGGGDAIPQYDQLGYPIGTSTEAAPSTLSVPPVGDFLNKALTDPGALQERQRPAGQPPSEYIPPAEQKFDYIPPPSADDQRQLERDRQQPPLQPSSFPAQQPSNGPTQFGQADQQQLASLGGILQQAFQSLLGAVTQPDLKQEGPPVNGGIRDDAGQASQEVASLGSAADTAGGALKSLTDAAAAAAGGLNSGGPQTVTAAGGGHIRGPGTGTSDSIPAMLSDGEYVLTAEATRRAGVENLDAFNAGHALGGIIKRHFADGGSVSKAGSAFAGELSITYDPNTGGAYINGNLFPPGHPLLDDPAIKAAIERSKAAMKDEPSGKKHKSDFTGVFGGHVFGEAGSYAKGGLVGNSRASFGARLSTMGFAGGGLIDVPHLAAGGMPDVSSQDVSAQAVQPTGADMPLHAVDLRTNQGDFRVMAPEEVARQMSRAAVAASSVQTGPRPSWYGS